MVRLSDGGSGPRRGAGKLAAAGLRFEQSLAGQAAISVLAMVTVLIGVVWNLPDSEVKRASIATLQPIAVPTGLQQAWKMYGPDPISGVETTEVVVTMADGSERVWSWQRGDRLIGPFSWYHWQKLKEQSIREPASRAGIAHWAVRQLTSRGEEPTRVRIQLRVQPLTPPGSDTGGPVHQELLYDETLTGPP